ncbi:MAG TPA: hypothetical protein VJV05_05545 [Pyrinomonadaceae bacterium]|nr:hypothetical protein [Pyrinomonadaceae bacterium]
MLRQSLVVAIALFVLATVNVYSQDAAARSSELATALNKTKYKKKEKPMVTVEFYIDIKNEPAVRDAASYSGNYGSEDGEYRLDLQVDGNGAASGSGQDWLNENRLSYTLKDAFVTGALLTATKVYSNGEQKKFEAVFVNRTVSNGTNANQIASRDTKFGLGFIQQQTGTDSQKGTQNWTNRVFLEGR